ncbi:hypothetical protein Tco_1009842, partial [Tanacetum coccineum]
DIFKIVSIVVCFGTAGELSVAATTTTLTVVGLYGPYRRHFLRESPFGLRSMYHKKRDCHSEYLHGASIGGRSFNPAAMILLCI